MTVSVYLSNNNIDAVIGTTGKSVRIRRVCHTQIPEGSLINGIITNEADLAEQLKSFWEENKLPKKGVSLVINSSQFVLKTITLPKVKDKKIREMLPMEFHDVTDQKDPILDYMVASAREKNTISVNAVMVERSFIQGYLSLFDAIGVKVSAINVARASRTRLLGTLRQLRDQTCVVMIVDGSNISSMFWADKEVIYATQRRVFSEPGTPQFGAELARQVSSIQQFAITQQIQHKIEKAYVAGTTAQEFEIYRQSVEEMGMDVEFATLDPEKHIRMNKQIEEDYSHYLAQIGDLMRGKHDINLVPIAKKKVKEKASGPVVWKQYVIPPVALLLVGGVAAGVLFYDDRKKTKELEALQAYLNDPSHLDVLAKSEILQAQIAELTATVEQIERIGECISSYPHMNSRVVQQLQECASGQAVELAIRSYDASNGVLNVDTKGEQVALINRFIDTLEASGIFDDVQYTGYSYNESENLYTINVQCYLAEQAGK